MALSLVIKKYWYFLLSFVLLGIVTVGRIWYSFKSGFILPDEALYYANIKYFFENGKFFYQSRLPFQVLLIATFFLFGIKNVWDYMLVIPLVMYVFSVLTLIVLDELLKENQIRGRKWIVLSFPFMTTFVMSLPFALTETVSLLFVTLGVLFLCREKYLAGSSLFSLATLFREPYIIFLLGNLVLLVCKRRNWKRFLLPFLAFSPLIMFVTHFNVYFWETPVYRILEKQILVADPSTHRIYAPQEFMGLLDRISYSVWNFFIGLFLGWTPLFLILGLVGLALKIREERNLLFWNSLFAYLSYFGGIFYVSKNVFYTKIISYSAITRFSHVSLFGSTTMKINRKLFVAGICVAVLSVPCFYQILSVYRGYSLQDENPWMRLYRATRGKRNVLVYGEPIERISLFLDESVVIKIPLNQTEFMLDIQNYDYVFLYGEIHNQHFPALKNRSPWYLEILNGNSNLTLIEIWKDPYSYCYEVKI